MLRYFGIFLLGLFSLGVRSDEFDDFPWLLKISSTYTDSAGGEARRFEGHGFVLRLQNRYFVATASHLSQGGAEAQRPTLSVERLDPTTGRFKTLRVLRRVAHNRRDVELMEIEAFAGLVPLAEWQSPESIDPRSRPFFPRGRLALISPWKERFGRPQDPVGFVPLSLNAYLPETSRLVPAFASPVRGLGAERINELQRASGSQLYRQALLMGVDATDGELVAALPSRPGMSGLPLVARIADCLCVNGLVTSSSRAFSSSWFVPDALINFTLFKLAQLPRELDLPAEHSYHQVGDVYWRQRAGLLYRVSRLAVRDASGRSGQMNFEEAVFGRGATGNGTRADGGNGTRADGGAGAQLPADLMPGTALFGGESITAFVVPVRGIPRLLPADFASYNFIMERLYQGRLSLAQVSVLRPRDNLLEAVKQRLESMGFREGSGGRVSVTLVSDLMLPITAHRRAAAEATFEFRSRLFGGVNGLKISLRLDGRRYVADFDAQGVPVGVSARGFEPVVAFREEGGSGRLIVDVAGLLLTPTSTYNFEWEEQRENVGARYGLTQLQNSVLRFRAQRDDGSEWQIFADHLML